MSTEVELGKEPTVAAYSKEEEEEEEPTNQPTNQPTKEEAFPTKEDLQEFDLEAKDAAATTANAPDLNTIVLHPLRGTYPLFLPRSVRLYSNDW
jgi:hypothetical protein